MNAWNVLRPLLLAAAVTTSLAGCTEPMSELDRYIREVRQRPPPDPEPVPEPKQPPTFTYRADDLRDPFRSARSSAEEEESALETEDPDAPDPLRTKELLEGFPLDALRMVGTFGESPSKYALIQDPNGVVHRVLPGNYLGTNHGQILGVFDDRVELEERVPDRSGGWERKRTALALDDTSGRNQTR